MASAQNIERALREKFGSEETIVTLAEILAVLKTHQSPHGAAGNQKKQQGIHGTQQNASPAQGQTRDTVRQGLQASTMPSKATQPQPQS